MVAPRHHPVTQLGGAQKIDGRSVGRGLGQDEVDEELAESRQNSQS